MALEDGTAFWYCDGTALPRQNGRQSFKIQRLPLFRAAPLLILLRPVHASRLLLKNFHV
ncbi:hypothetical protein [Streptomyces gilvifuscus]|uniref:Uncharacterized protein n=1 Tax=Streptomyces gilvifuscus TaxID=1550617 RepID=A0ABT5G358_9ACTN|nr:hypothetical protein [Streptomyces gilvifuscus]MDC2959287.1 hypothetical protein [Streptomyces gilvifuscus]